MKCDKCGRSIDLRNDLYFKLPAYPGTHYHYDCIQFSYNRERGLYRMISYGEESSTLTLMFRGHPIEEKVHECVLHTFSYLDIARGNKTFVLGQFGRKFQTGDYVRFKLIKEDATIRSTYEPGVWMISHILDSTDQVEGLLPNYSIISLKEVSMNEES